MPRSSSGSPAQRLTSHGAGSGRATLVSGLGARLPLMPLVQPVQRLEQQRPALGHRHAVAPPASRARRAPRPSTSPDRRGSTASSACAQQRGQARRVAARSKSRASRRRAARRRSETRWHSAGSSTAFTKRRRASAACGDLAVHLRRRRGDDQPGAVEIGGANSRRSMVHVAALPAIASSISAANLAARRRAPPRRRPAAAPAWRPRPVRRRRAGRAGRSRFRKRQKISIINKKARKALSLPGLGFQVALLVRAECVDSTRDEPDRWPEARRSPTTTAADAHRLPDHDDLLLLGACPLRQAFQRLPLHWEYAISPHLSPRLARLRLLLTACRAGRAQRLPTAVVPRHYDLAFDVDLARARFDGTETIRVQVGEPTRTSSCTRVELEFHDVTIAAGAATQRAAVYAQRARRRPRP